ncbi:MAG: DUF721 domain-containing protein [Bacteroidales bacterium]
MRRQQVLKLGDLFGEFLKKEGLEDGIIRMKIFEAWDEVVGEKLSSYTMEKFYRDGKLFCRISSSAARNTLFMQRIEIVEKINKKLEIELVKVLILK